MNARIAVKIILRPEDATKAEHAKATITIRHNSKARRMLERIFRARPHLSYLYDLKPRPICQIKKCTARVAFDIECGMCKKKMCFTHAHAIDPNDFSTPMVCDICLIEARPSELAALRVSGSK
jgi:hypothetical protein